MTTHDTSSGAVVLSHLSKSYGDVRAVRSIDLTIVPGETVALLGPNGAGKSTTIDMVLGLTRPDSGTVSLFGMSPAEAAAAGVVGGMLQTGSLVDYLSVRELVTMVASLYPSARCRGCAGAQRVLGVRPPPDQEAVGGPGPTRAVRDRARRGPGTAAARRADVGARRRGAARVLGVDAGPLTWRCAGPGSRTRSSR